MRFQHVADGLGHLAGTVGVGVDAVAGHQLRIVHHRMEIDDLEMIPLSQLLNGGDDALGNDFLSDAPAVLEGTDGRAEIDSGLAGQRL